MTEKRTKSSASSKTTKLASTQSRMVALKAGVVKAAKAKSTRPKVSARPKPSLTSTPPTPAKRTGARRMAEIPRAVLAELNAGRTETVNLVEWLAIDVRRLAKAVATGWDRPDDFEALTRAAEILSEVGVQGRSRGMGAVCRNLLSKSRRAARLHHYLATHSSDMVRAWAAYSYLADERLDLAARLAAARPFAADANMAVREAAWDSFRDHLAKDLPSGVALLVEWVHDPDPNVRRCAVEATRPRGVWTAHLEPFKRDPEPGRVLLEPVRSDPSDYVRRAVANWLNDASKTRPDWVLSLRARWLAESPTKETAWILHHATRTLRKKA